MMHCLPFQGFEQYLTCMVHIAEKKIDIASTGKAWRASVDEDACASMVAQFLWMRGLSPLRRFWIQHENQTVVDGE
jgi:hypothetical protein